jgi:hypothetical protein
LWRDYYWPTKVAILLLVLSLLWGIALAGWPQLEAASPPLVKALADSSLQSLLTLTIGLFIAVNFYARARGGLLDGDDHYNIARALAFGYFKNFLVPALQLAHRDGRELQVFRPVTISDLHAYSREIEPVLKSLFEHEWLPVVETPLPGGPPRRTVLSLRSPRGSAGAGRGAIGPRDLGDRATRVATELVGLVTRLVPEVPFQRISIDPGPGVTRTEEQSAEPGFFFDAPTALFTVQDFYAALNRRREDQGKEPIRQDKVLKYQNGQISSFFAHLKFLFGTEAGLAAVADLVGSMTVLEELGAGMREVSLDELRQRYLS